ncbi:hypothetical protein TTRE_0000500801 [Trichuris trichiura]|uniref:C2H2-type domain-containing protein n=1 Tax=Trichuris trichiura TaxID=36087 RepID=A0A077Z936_TRITR|nr:hypothetical protein TTRE_0000500801 [Trichuris trichiura]
MAEKMLYEMPTPVQLREPSPFEPPPLTYFGPSNNENEDGDPPDCGYSQVAQFDYICNKCQVCCHTEEIYLEHVEEWHQNVVPKQTYMCNTCGHLSHNIILHKRHKMVHRCDNVLMFMCKVEQSLTELKTGPVSVDERHEAILNRYYSLMQKPSIRRWLIRAAARRRRNKSTWKPKGKGPLFCSLSSIYREGRNIGKAGHSEKSVTSLLPPIHPLMERPGEPAKHKARKIRYDPMAYGTSSELFSPPEDDADEGDDDDQLWLPPKSSEANLKGSTDDDGAQVIDAQVRHPTQSVFARKSNLKIKLPNLKSVRAVPAKHRRSIVGRNPSAMAISIQNSAAGRPPVRMTVSNPNVGFERPPFRMPIAGSSEGIAPVATEKPPFRTTLPSLSSLIEKPPPFTTGIPYTNIAPKGSPLKMAVSFPNIMAGKSSLVKTAIPYTNSSAEKPPARMAFSCPSSVTDETPVEMGDAYQQSLSDKPPVKKFTPYMTGKDRKSNVTMGLPYSHGKYKRTAVPYVVSMIRKAGFRTPGAYPANKDGKSAFESAIDRDIAYSSSEQGLSAVETSFPYSGSNNEESAADIGVSYENGKKKKPTVKSPVANKSKNKICLKRIPGSNNYAVKKIEISKGNESEQAKSVRPAKEKCWDMRSVCPVCCITFKKPWHAIAHLIDDHGGTIHSLQKTSCQPGCSDTLVNFLGTTCSSCRTDFDSQPTYLRHMFQRHTRKLFRRLPVIQSKLIFGTTVLDSYSEEQWLRIEIRLLPKP